MLDHSFLTLYKDSSFAILLVYIDYVILAGKSLNEFDKIKNILDYQFKIKDLGQLKFIFWSWDSLF